MDEQNQLDLAKARLDRAKELIGDAEILLEKESYKSANNRAYYAIEKTMNGLLALKGVYTKTHKGCLLQFNEQFVKNEEEPFTREEFIEALKSERIRNVSDYDDFYIAGKKECENQVAFSKHLYEKAIHYTNPSE